MWSRRTLLVISLLAVAVLGPSGAWWVSGSREAERQAHRLRTAAVEGFEAELTARARLLAERLEDLRAVEARRPFYHYQNLTHEPRGASQGLSIIPSPLAEGAPDVLVGAHFQILPDGHVNLPTVNEDFPEFSTEEGFAMYCELLAELEQAMVLEERTELDAPGEIVDEQDRRRPADRHSRVVTLDRSQWQQIERANQVYAELAGRDPISPGATDPPTDSGAGTVSVTVAPLAWHTMLLGSGPVLAALRQVHTPAGVLVQGFTIFADAAVAPDGAGRLRFQPLSTRGKDRMIAAVGVTGWGLSADSSAVTRAAAEAAVARLAEFRRHFLWLFLAALIAASCVAVIVAQSEALANQRAQFAAAAAHELKTPLATLQLYGEMLAEGLGDPAHSSTYAHRLAVEASRLGRVVTNILDLSRLERGTPLARPSSGDLGTALRSSLERLRPALAAHGMDVELVPPVPEITASFDGDAVDQILANLLDNAERYSRGAPVRRVAVEVTSDETWATIHVRDSGPGIADAIRRRLFRPFARGADHAQPQGLGLGLALARALARAQGGELQLVDASPGVKALSGAHFAFRVPLTKGRQS